MSKIFQNLLKSTRIIKPNNVDLQKRLLFKKSCTKKKDECPFIVSRVTPPDYERVLDLMWDAYYPDEPAVSALNLGRIRNCVFDEIATKILSKGYSIMARCKYNGNLVGAAINDVTCPWDPKVHEKTACSIRCKNITKLFLFWAYVQKTPDLWNRCCTNQIFEIESVFVQEDNRKKGLGKKLIEVSRLLATDCGFKVVRVDASAFATARICEQLKMKLVDEILYCSYIGQDNKPIFDIPPPNDSIKVYIDTPLYKKIK